MPYDVLAMTSSRRSRRSLDRLPLAARSCHSSAPSLRDAPEVITAAAFLRTEVLVRQRRVLITIFGRF